MKKKNYSIEGTEDQKLFSEKRWQLVATVEASSKKEALAIFKNALHIHDENVTITIHCPNDFASYRARLF